MFDQDKVKFCQVYVDVVDVMARSYLFLLMDDNEFTRKVMLLLVACSKAKNLKVAVNALTFWDYLKESLFTAARDGESLEAQVPNLNEKNHIFKPALEVFGVVIL